MTEEGKPILQATVTANNPTFFCESAQSKLTKTRYFGIITIRFKKASMTLKKWLKKENESFTQATSQGNRQQTDILLWKRPVHSAH